MSIYKKLMNIQAKLKAPKSQRNNFGKYNYRSCEDILEAVKPLLLEEELILLVSDRMIHIEGRFYICATATILDNEGEEISTSGYAREVENKKGMDESQITGATSSYARKYALNGLFAIDDTKDADSTNTHGKTANKTVSEEKKSPREIEILKLVNKSDTKRKIVFDALKTEKVKKIDFLSEVGYTKLIKDLKNN